MPIADAASLLHRPDIQRALRGIDTSRGEAKTRRIDSLERALSAEAGAPVDVHALVVAYHEQRRATVDQQLGKTLGAAGQRDTTRPQGNARGPTATRLRAQTGSDGVRARRDARTATPDDDGARTRRERVADWMFRGPGTKGVVTALAGVSAMLLPACGAAEQAQHGADLTRNDQVTSRVVDAPASQTPDEIAASAAAAARRNIAHDLVDKAARQLLHRSSTYVDASVEQRALAMLAAGTPVPEVERAVHDAIAKTPEARAARAPALVQDMHEAIYGRPGPADGPAVQKARALLIEGMDDAHVEKALRPLLTDVAVPTDADAPLGRVDLSTQTGKDVFRAAAFLAKVPRAWADSVGLRNLVQAESKGAVGRPNYTYGARSASPDRWASVHAELRAGRITELSSATGLGQLLLDNVEKYMPAGRAGIGDPVQEAAGMLRYIQAAYGNPEVAWGNHSQNPNRHQGVPRLYFQEGY